ncbi:hypothetical protein [Spongiivirga citrea]|uniref:Uncharacterized protein n=1 Tax=Spongiivirga citrea TaxID=1481457 RepID=A0A6M0CKU3_9FLAO|nr:hypothetical protein [Spongiivirga citrea]NER18528.1 hypothetical protein [Spongiivirga citrea]
MDQPKKPKKKSKLEIKKDLQDQYGAWKVLAVAGYVNSPEEKLARDLIEDVAKINNFIPSYFATIILTEGLGIDYLDHDYNYRTDSAGNKVIRNDIELSGFDVGGLDDFGSEYPRYKKYLPSWFDQGSNSGDFSTGSEFYSKSETNERNETVLSAQFSNMESVIWACAATLSHRRDLFQKHRKNLGYPAPTEDQLAYWNYIYYQGEGQAKRWLIQVGGLDIFGLNGILPAKTVTKKNRNAHDVALSNLASWRYLQTFKIFSN